MLHQMFLFFFVLAALGELEQHGYGMTHTGSLFQMIGILSVFVYVDLIQEMWSCTYSNVPISSVFKKHIFDIYKCTVNTIIQNNKPS